MKTKVQIIVIIASLLTFSLAHADSKEQGEQISVPINGLICDFCAVALKKSFAKEEAVSNIEVDLTKKVILIDLKEGQMLKDEIVEKRVHDAGYDIGEITRK